MNYIKVKDENGTLLINVDHINCIGIANNHCMGSYPCYKKCSDCKDNGFAVKIGIADTPFVAAEVKTAEEAEAKALKLLEEIAVLTGTIEVRCINL